jgi:hypothetical protein
MLRCVSFNDQVACSDGEIGGARTGRLRQRRQAAGDRKEPDSHAMRIALNGA